MTTALLAIAIFGAKALTFVALFIFLYFILAYLLSK